MPVVFFPSTADSLDAQLMTHFYADKHTLFTGREPLEEESNHGKFYHFRPASISYDEFQTARSPSAQTIKTVRSLTRDISHPWRRRHLQDNGSY